MPPVNQDDGTAVMGSSPARGNTQRPAGGITLSVLATCLWFGIVAGLTERLLYFLFPRPVGGNDLWYDALADLLLFLGWLFRLWYWALLPDVPASRRLRFS